MKTAIILAAIVFAVTAWVGVSTSDYYEAIRHHDLCQRMVKAGTWPERTCKES